MGKSEYSVNFTRKFTMIFAIVALLAVTALGEGNVPGEDIFQSKKGLVVSGETLGKNPQTGSVVITSPHLHNVERRVEEFLNSAIGPQWRTYLRPIDRVEKFPNPVKDDLGYFGYWCLLIGFICMAVHSLLLHARSTSLWKQILRSPHHGNHRNCHPCLLAHVHRSWPHVGRRSSRNFLTCLLGTIRRLGLDHATHALGYPCSCWSPK